MKSNQLPAHVSMQRIQTFLAEEEVDDWASSIKRADEELDARVVANKVGFQNATFVWHWNPAEVQDTSRSDAVFALSDISINFPLGKLTLVTGVTGSGKSSLLAALLGGEMIHSLHHVQTQRVIGL
jgi:ABC-type multidrug transport system fused ATPase/permease subunit